MKKNLYVEYREWRFFWGLNIDSEDSINKIIQHHNKLGWNCVMILNGDSNVNFLRKIMILFVSLLTLGFVNYYVGVSLLFERDSVVSSDGSMKQENTVC